jgi:hypothetical protein
LTLRFIWLSARHSEYGASAARELDALETPVSHRDEEIITKLIQNPLRETVVCATVAYTMNVRESREHAHATVLMELAQFPCRLASDQQPQRARTATITDIGASIWIGPWRGLEIELDADGLQLGCRRCRPTTLGANGLVPQLL